MAINQSLIDASFKLTLPPRPSALITGNQKKHRRWSPPPRSRWQRSTPPRVIVRASGVTEALHGGGRTSTTGALQEDRIDQEKEPHGDGTIAAREPTPRNPRDAWAATAAEQGRHCRRARPRGAAIGRGDTAAGHAVGGA